MFFVFNSGSMDMNSWEYWVVEILVGNGMVNGCSLVYMYKFLVLGGGDFVDVKMFVCMGCVFMVIY